MGAGVIVIAAYSLMLLGNTSKLPADVIPLLVAILALGGVAHIANRIFVPDAIAVVLPIAFLLNGIGYVMILRIDLANQQELRAAPGGLDRCRGGGLRAHSVRDPPQPRPRPSNT